MKTKNLVLAFLLLSIGTVVLRAQKSTPADLSGTWKLNLEKSKLPKGTKIQSQTLVITTSGVSIQIHYSTDGRESIETYITDGKERIIREVQGGEAISKAYWKGSALTTETGARLRIPDQPLFNGSDLIHSKERWKLSSDGRSLTVESDDPKRISIYDMR
jgi:hypothetical protein